jgi:hypothetical protein
MRHKSRYKPPNTGSDILFEEEHDLYRTLWRGTGGGAPPKPNHRTVAGVHYDKPRPLVERSTDSTD